MGVGKIKKTLAKLKEDLYEFSVSKFGCYNLRVDIMAENQNIEYKQTWKDEYLKWISGFANANGGKIYIGIDDDGNVTGAANYSALMEEIPNKVSGKLGLVLDVNLKKKMGKNYIEIVVRPSEVPISLHGSYYYRSGSTKHELKGQSLDDFLLKKMGRSWDDTPVPNATLKSIDSTTVKRFIDQALMSKRISGAAAEDTIKSLLINLHLINEKNKLKAAVVLLFGRDPLQFFSHAYFKIGRFGSSDADLKFQDTIETNVFEMPDKVMEILRAKYLTSSITYEGLQRKEVLEYPEEALREAILNSIVHKNYGGTTIQLSVYDDKLILWNPGSLPPELSIDALKRKHASYPRNKNIAEIFYKAGYIEAWGRGIIKIMEACKAAGLPEPIIEEPQGGFQIIFFKDVYSDEQLKKFNINERQIRALKYLKNEEFLSNSVYQQINSLGKTISTIELKDLVDKGLLVQEGKAGRGIKYRRKG